MAIAKNTLRILSLERFGETFKQDVMRLRYTPKRLLPLPDNGKLVILEGDHRQVPLREREDLREGLESTEEIEDFLKTGIEGNNERALVEDQFSPQRGEVG